MNTIVSVLEAKDVASIRAGFCFAQQQRSAKSQVRVRTFRRRLRVPLDQRSAATTWNAVENSSAALTAVGIRSVCLLITNHKLVCSQTGVLRTLHTENVLVQYKTNALVILTATKIVIINVALMAAGDFAERKLVKYALRRWTLFILWIRQEV